MVDHAGSDSGGDGQIGDVGRPLSGTESGHAHGGQIGVVGYADRQTEMGREPAPRQLLGPLLWEVGRPEEPASGVVDHARRPDDRMRRRTMSTFGRQSGSVSDAGTSASEGERAERRRRSVPSASTSAARILVPPTSAARTGRVIAGSSSPPPAFLTSLVQRAATPTSLRGRTPPCGGGGEDRSVAWHRCPCAVGGRTSRSRLRWLPGRDPCASPAPWPPH